MSLRTIDQLLAGDENELLLGFLQAQRDAVIDKVEGLSDADAAARLVPSLTTPIGVLNHLIGVERWWFRVQFSGESDVPLTWNRDDVDADFKAEGVTVEGAIADYRVACAESDAIVQDADLDGLAAKAGRRGGYPSLRWIVLHMIEETARHAGHVDILREQLDAR